MKGNNTNNNKSPMSGHKNSTAKQKTTKPKEQKPFPIEIMVSFLIIVVIIRLMLNLLPSYKIDMGVYRSWAMYLNQVKFTEFYNNAHCVYGPGYLYVLWFSGKLFSVFQMADASQEFLIKSWSVLSDLIGAFLIYLIGRKHKKPQLGFILAVVYALNPGIFFNSSVWGQFDTVPATMLLGVVYLFDTRRSIPAVLLYAAACVTKPQSGFLAPIVIVLFLKNMPLDNILECFKNNFKTLPTKFIKEFSIKAFLALFGGMVVYAVMTLPFKGSRSFLWVIDLYLKSSQDYPYATANGFNLWTLLGGQVVRDTDPYKGLTYLAWATLLLGAVALFSIYITIKKSKNSLPLYYSSYIMLFGTFLVYTKMHERYLLPAVIFLTVGVLWDKKLCIPLVALSLCRLGNEWYAYYLGNKSVVDPGNYSPWIANQDNFATFVAAITLITFIYSVVYVFLPSFTQKNKNLTSKPAKLKR